MTRLASGAFAIAVGIAGYGMAFAADTPAPTSGGGGDGHHSGFREACGADLQTYCASSKTHDERRACVEANKEKFSAGCKSFMASHPRHDSSTTPPASGQ